MRRSMVFSEPGILFVVEQVLNVKGKREVPPGG